MHNATIISVNLIFLIFFTLSDICIHVWIQH